MDRTYNLDEKYFLPMLEYLAAADTETTFHLEVKVDLLSDRVLDFLEKAPLHRFQLEIGVQTTNQPTLKAINRFDNWPKLVHNCQRLLGFGNMHLHMDLIAGLPYESLKEFRKSFDDVYGLQPHMLQLGFLKVLPGTQMSHETQEHGLLYMDEPPYEILATNYMPYEAMQFLKRLENVLDQTYNSGYYGHLLQYLIGQQGEGAFAFYTKLTNWWVDQGHYPQTHNAKGVAKILYDYIRANLPAPEQTVALELLRYDVFVDLPGWQPEYLSWHTEEIFDTISSFWRDEEQVLKYIPDYKFSSWRQIHKNYPVELFRYDPLTGQKRSFYLLQNCTKAEKQILELKSIK